MAITLNASTSSGLVQTADTSGIIQLQSNGSTKATIGPSGFSYPGGILQVIQGTLTTFSTTTSSSFVDTGLSATITPTSASNKILVIYSASVGSTATVGGAINQIVRNSTSVWASGVSYSGIGNGSLFTLASGTYLDSPATTSAVTYKIQHASQNASNTAYFNVDYGGYAGEVATITLMEISA